MIVTKLLSNHLIRRSERGRKRERKKEIEPRLPDARVLQA